eukprot:15455677-Alexandrium_andersonii.AAC.1
MPSAPEVGLGQGASAAKATQLAPQGSSGCLTMRIRMRHPRAHVRMPLTRTGPAARPSPEGGKHSECA